MLVSVINRFFPLLFANCDDGLSAGKPIYWNRISSRNSNSISSLSNLILIISYKLYVWGCELKYPFKNTFLRYTAYSHLLNRMNLISVQTSDDACVNKGLQLNWFNVRRSQFVRIFVVLAATFLKINLQVYLFVSLFIVLILVNPYFCSLLLVNINFILCCSFSLLS